MMPKTKSDGKLIAKNFALLYSGELAGQVLSFFLVVAIARYFGDIGLGKYSFAFSFVTLFLVIADMGLPTFITKETSIDKNLAKLHLTKTFTLKLILNTATFALTIATIFITRKDYETILLVALAAVAMFFFNLAGIHRSIFQAYEIMKYEAFLKVVERIIAVVLAIILLHKGYGMTAMFMVLIFSNAVYYFAIHFLTKKNVSSISLSFDKDSWKKSLKGSVHFWITIVFITLYFKIDTIMLTFMKGFQDTGWYNAALKIIEVLTRIPFLLNVAIFPAFSKLHRVSHEKTKLLYERYFYYMVVLALPIVTGLTMLADRIIIYIYSSEFSNSIIALQILSGSLVFVFVNYLMGYLLNAIDKQKLFTYSITATAVLNVVLNLILIPKYSYIGASFATLISEIVSFFILYYFTCMNKFGINLAKVLAKPLIANIAMIGFIAYFKNLHLLLVVGISAAIYFTFMLLIKGIGKEKFNLLRPSIPKK